MISVKLLNNFTEITLRHGCSLVNLLLIFRTPFLKDTSDGLLLKLRKVAHYFEFPGIMIHNFPHKSEKREGIACIY